jgi:phage major head subunit gpT-like protein
MLGFDMNVIDRGIRGTFGREFITRQRRVKYPKWSLVVDSNKKIERYNSLSTLPQLQELTDERVLAGFSEYSYDIENKVYATGIKVPRTLFEFDQTGQLRTLVQSLGARVTNFPDKLMFALLGANAECYDGADFFSATHDLGDGTSQTNIATGTMDNTSLTGGTKTYRDNMIAAAQMDVNKAKGVMSEMVDDRGEPWHEELDAETLVVLCHMRAEFFIRSALEAAIVSDTGNVLVKNIGAIITTNRTEPFEDGGGDVRYGTFYLLKVDTPVRPMIFQRFAPRQNFPDTIPEQDQQILQALSAVEVQTVMRGGSNIDAHTFFDDEFLFGPRTIYCGGYGMWQNAVVVRASDYANE